MLYLSPNEANLFEYSILHYFIWRHDEVKQTTDKEQQNDDTITATVDPTTTDNSSRCYKRIIQVLKEELPHIDAMMSETTPTTSLSSSTPEVCYRWLKYATIRNILVNTQIPKNNAKRKRDMANETANLTKVLQLIPEEEITLENAKEVLSTLREEHMEVKKITESLETKLIKSEKIYSELLKFNNKKLRLEQKLASLQAVEEEAKKTDTEQIVIDDNHNVTNLDSVEEATTIEQNVLDEQHDVNKATEDDDVAGDQSNNVRAKLENKKRKLQIQETMYANAILYEVHHEKEQQKVTKNGVKIPDFEARVQELIEFKHEFGHCQVGIKNHKSLYHWVTQMRRYYRRKNPALSPERIAKLDALGVVWDVIDANKPRTFDANVELCREFKEKHGHLRIPLITERNEDGTEPTEDDIRFRIWAQSMRQQYKNKLDKGIVNVRLDNHRVALLDSIGFQWSINATSVEGGSNIDVENQTPGDLIYRMRIDQLRKVKEIYGNCNEKKNVLAVYPNNNALVKWMKEQRQQMRFMLAGKGTRLNEERQEMLRSIEFDFDPRRHYTPPTSNKKTWPTKMELLALELQEKKKNNNHQQDSENSESDDDNDIE